MFTATAKKTYRTRALALGWGGRRLQSAGSGGSARRWVCRHWHSDQRSTWPAGSLWCSREAPGSSGPWTPFLRVANKGKDCSSISFVGRDKCCCSCLVGQMRKSTYTASQDALGRGHHAIAPNLSLSYLPPGQDFAPPRGILASSIFYRLLLRLSGIIIAVSACSCPWRCTLQPWSHLPPIFKNAFILFLSRISDQPLP